MPSLAEYFAENRPKPKYNFGDRVGGKYNGIPYVGTVYTDNMRNEEEGPMASIHLDFPMLLEGKYTNYIRVKYKDIKEIRKST
jgi:hypothetical protein